MKLMPSDKFLDAFAQERDTPPPIGRTMKRAVGVAKKTNGADRKARVKDTHGRDRIAHITDDRDYWRPQ
jgi:hypothetical protein